MGLDNKVLFKPKLGYESEYRDIFENHIRPRKVSDGVVNRYFEISIPPYENLGAPKVGRDREADEWILQHYETNKVGDESKEQFNKRAEGYNVLQLVKCDGISKYQSLVDDPYVFRGQFLRDVEDIIGGNYLEQAYQYMSAKELKIYGEEILLLANNYAKETNNEHIEGTIDEDPPDGTAFKTHLLKSWGKWCVFWGEKGHGMEPDF